MSFKEHETVYSEKERKILQAASELFSKTGYFQTSMKDVAQRAGIAVGTIYLYYKTKEELLDGIFTHASSLLFNRVKQTVAQCETPPEKLEAFIKESIDFSFKYPYYFIIVFVDFHRKAIEFTKSVIYKFFREYFAFGTEILQEGKESGDFVIPDEHLVIYGMTGFWGAYVLREILAPGYTAKKRKREEIYSIYESTILNGLKKQYSE